MELIELSYNKYQDGIFKEKEKRKNRRTSYWGCSPADVRVLLEYDPIGTSGKLSLILCSATAPASASIPSTSSPLVSKANEGLPKDPALIMMSLNTPFISPSSLSTSGITPPSPDLTLVTAPIAGPIATITSPRSIVDSNLSCICSSAILS